LPAAAKPTHLITIEAILMIKHVLSILIFLAAFEIASCTNKENKKITVRTDETLKSKKQGTEKANLIVEDGKGIKDFLPAGYIIFDKIYADLNKDGLADCAIIIKGTNKKNIIKDQISGELDRNRRGLIILLNKIDHYEVVTKNYDCFSSGNEDGGVYFAPELSIEIDKGNLYIHYSHGRYGYWRYTFRLQNSDFELIGYDSSDNRGAVINNEISINYLTKKKIVKENTSANAESGEEFFKETVTKVNNNKPIKLSKIKDFDRLDVSND
jgi:hypothetical protein